MLTIVSRLNDQNYQDIVIKTEFDIYYMCMDKVQMQMIQSLQISQLVSEINFFYEIIP